MTALDRTAIAGVGLVLVSAAGFGSMVVFGRWAYDDGVNPQSLLFMRFAVASALLFAMAARQSVPWPSRRGAVISGLMGLIFVGNSLGYFVALSMAPAALVAVLFFTYPVVVMLGERLLFKERFGVPGVAAVILALGGSVLIAADQHLAAGAGAWLALLAAAFYGGYVLLSRATSKEDPIARAALITAVAAVVLGAIAWPAGVTLPTTARGWAGVLCLAIFSSVVAMAAFLAGTARIGPTYAATISAAEPAISALLGAIVLNEPLAWRGVSGVALVIASTLLVLHAQRDAGRRRQAAVGSSD
jgi:drug/metabolite transporter (DMT)-like permease